MGVENYKLYCLQSNKLESGNYVKPWIKEKWEEKSTVKCLSSLFLSFTKKERERKKHHIAPWPSLSLLPSSSSSPPSPPPRRRRRPRLPPAATPQSMTSSLSTACLPASSPTPSLPSPSPPMAPSPSTSPPPATSTSTTSSTTPRPSPAASATAPSPRSPASRPAASSSGSTLIVSRWICLLPTTSILMSVGSQESSALINFSPSIPANPAAVSLQPSSNHFNGPRTSSPIFIGREEYYYLLHGALRGIA